MKRLFFLFLLLSCLSCSKDEDQTDKVTSGRMAINGVTHHLVFGGYGIDLNADGTHTLTIWAYRNDATPESVDGTIIKLRYKRKGNDIVEFFDCYANPAGFHVNAVGPTFHNKVTVNNRKQLTMAFSGTMQSGDDVVTISDGYINYLYEEPFEE